MEKLKVFISWSGAWSGQVAHALRSWIPDVLQFVEPWLSSTDIDKGARWPVEVARELESTSVGIICLTPENLAAPWILFEAGALSKNSRDTYVCTFLQGLRKAELAPPLSQFQATEAIKDDVEQLIRTINQAKPDFELPADQCKRVFERWWPDLEKKLEEIESDASAPDEHAVLRSDREILEELLNLTRALERHNSGVTFDNQLFAVLGHELRSPTNSILGYSALLLDEIYDPLTEKQLSAVQKVNLAARHLLGVINDFSFFPTYTPVEITEMTERYLRPDELTK